MRKLAVVCASCWALWACQSTAPATQAPNHPRANDSLPRQAAAQATSYYSENATTIQTKVGESFVIALPSNVSTPMEWFVDINEAAEGKLEAAPPEYRETPPQDCDSCTGYSGTQLHSFKALQPGHKRLLFELKHVARQNEQPQKRLFFEVDISP